MKRNILLTILALLIIATPVFSSPSNTISIPNSFSPNTAISSSEANANFNEVGTKFNAHTHTDITSLGTVTTGSWNATAITAEYGGTGLATITDGAVMLGSGTGAVTPLALTTAGAIMIGDGTTDPTTLSAFSSATGTLKTTYGGTASSSTTYCDLTANVTGALPIANGGTAATTLAGAFIAQAVQLSYTGNGNDDRSITGASFNPNFAIIQKTSSTVRGAPFKSFTTDDSDYAGNVAVATDIIQDFVTGGIQLGTDVDSNANGETYDVLLLLTATAAGSG